MNAILSLLSFLRLLARRADSFQRHPRRAGEPALSRLTMKTIIWSKTCPDMPNAPKASAAGWFREYGKTIIADATHLACP
jgi:hypothetical protein